MATLVFPDELSSLLATYNVAGVTLAVLKPDGHGDAYIATQAAGTAIKGPPAEPVYDSTHFQICSLSKPIGAVYALDYFAKAGISMDTSVNSLLAKTSSTFRFRAAEGCPSAWGDEVTLKHLIDHTGPQMHYVNGVPRSDAFPPALALISGSKAKPAPYNYAPLEVNKKPGTIFGYSGGGFIVLQHLLELREGKPVSELFDEHLRKCGTGCYHGLSFAHEVANKPHAHGYREDGSEVAGGRLNFPPLAAGAIGSAAGLADWLRVLAVAYNRPDGCGAISQDTARKVLENRPDLGSEAFMRSRMGLGMFVFDVASDEPGAPNRWMLHQAANDGFRGVLLVCFDGPDARRGPRGLVVFANGDNNAMLLVAATMRALLSSKVAFDPPLQGLDFGRVPSMEGGFRTDGLKQEEIVNLGIKDLVLGAFLRSDAGTAEPDSKRMRK